MKKGIIIFASVMLAAGIGFCGFKVFNMSSEMVKHRLDDEIVTQSKTTDEYEYIPDDDEEGASVETVGVLRANSIANYLDLLVKIDAKDTYVVSYLICKGKRFDPQRIISDYASYTYSDVYTQESHFCSIQRTVKQLSLKKEFIH